MKGYTHPQPLLEHFVCWGRLSADTPNGPEKGHKAGGVSRPEGCRPALGRPQLRRIPVTARQAGLDLAPAGGRGSGCGAEGGVGLRARRCPRGPGAEADGASSVRILRPLGVDFDHTEGSFPPACESSRSSASWRGRGRGLASTAFCAPR